MRLSKIKLVGFKSFVDPTVIQFPTSLTGIIGPNGCGKSNVIDAVRWVMGETSAKNLRGDSMADVIFNGSTARKPVGQAAIELVFDNSEGKLGGQYAQFGEISIKRQVTRDGQSNYYLNGTKCRRKDITDIFLGTGLGPRSYSIIEQGMISRLIEAKPDELRIFIEEAAGISKYKERRRETENRIRHTRDNIDRINDLRSELEKRLETLQRQAKAAEKYKELKEEERLVKGQLQALRWRELDEESSRQQKEIASRETALEARVAELRKNEAAAENKREAQIEANEHFNHVQGEYYGIGAEIARLEQAIQHAKETRMQQERELGETEVAWQEAQEHIENDNRRIEELTWAQSEDDAKLAEAKSRLEQSGAVLAECEKDMHAWQQRWDEFNQLAAEQVRRAEVERARIEHLDQHLMQLRDREARLEQELENLAPNSLEAEIVALRDDADRQQRLLTELDSQAEHRQREIRETRERSDVLNREIRDQRDVLQGLRESVASLEALQAEALGKNVADVAAWLEQHQLDKARRLAQNIDVEAGWERAVETVLGFHLDAVCVDTDADLAGELARLSQGTLGLIVKDGRMPHVDPASLAAKVRSDWPLAGFLNRIQVADSTEQALQRRAQLADDASLITREGVWVGPNWIRVVRSASTEGGVIEREQKLKELEARLGEETVALETLEGQLETARETATTLEQQREAGQRERAVVAQQLSVLQSQLSAKKAQFESMNNRVTRLRTELDEVVTQADAEKEELQQARGRLEEALAATEGHNSDRDRLIEERDSYRIKLEDARKAARADREAAHEIELRCQAVRTQLVATRENLARIEKQLTHLSRRREELTAALDGGEGPIVEMGRELEQQLGKRSEAEARLIEARRGVEALDHEIRELNQQRHEIEQQVQTSRDEISTLRMAWQEINVRCQTILEQITEADYTVEALMEQLPAEANVDQWQENVERIGRSIQRLGAINLAAIDEFTEQSERKQYLDAQYEDLTEALTTLENAIHKIDKETRQRFKDTFDQVNSGLQEKFPRLFGGGHAYLELTGDDLLSTGVTVMARPPGKRNSTIHLLSGGEKALTAVAMVFSIFELNPAPFCMLDEVDAPLDDANVGRFCKMVKEMSDRVQFIFITHNKVTMEMADQLAGVTMHEPGVSRLVAVDLDEAVQMAAAS